MKDFNLSKYLRNNTLLKENFLGYSDVRPLAEFNEELEENDYFKRRKNDDDAYYGNKDGEDDVIDSTSEFDGDAQDLDMDIWHDLTPEQRQKAVEYIMSLKNGTDEDFPEEPDEYDSEIPKGQQSIY